MPIVSLETQIKTQLESEKELDLGTLQSKVEMLLQQAPLSDNALAYYGNGLMLKNDWADIDTKILDVVKARNPRNRQNLNAMLIYSLENGNYPGALEVIDTLYLLDRNKHSALIELLKGIYNLETGPELINSHLANRPVWEIEFLYSNTRMIHNINLQKISRTIATSIELSEDISLIEPYIGRVLSALVKAGDVEKAFNLWSKATQKAEQKSNNININPATSLNYNPALTDIASPAPFNWIFYSTKDTAIEKDSNGVFVSFAGGKLTTIGQQYFKPQPGPLNLVVKANYRYTDRQGNFSLNVRCLSSNLPIIEVALDTASRGKGEVIKPLESFGDDCSLASLNIMAQPGVFSERISATFNYIAVEFAETEQ
jgi:tetratricopeptide (TPR) repeat protein